MHPPVDNIIHRARTGFWVLRRLTHYSICCISDFPCHQRTSFHGKSQDSEMWYVRRSLHISKPSAPATELIDILPFISEKHFYFSSSFAQARGGGLFGNTSMKGKAKKRQKNRSLTKKSSSSELSALPVVETLATKDLSIPSANLSSSAADKSTWTKSYDKIQKQFLTSQDGPAFTDLVRDHYQGFSHVSADQVKPSSFHGLAKATFERLRDANYFQYDIVMAGGKHTSRTFVKRTLVGEPGITYKYLGLRLFAHAWSGPGVSPTMKAVGEINQHMIKMTKQYENHGLCEYNLTLINFMEPSSHSKIGFKDEAHYGMGKVSVSWHADSSLESNSSIGVYHCLPTQRPAKWDWRIALRRSPENGNTDKKSPPPIALNTKDGDVYFLLGRFNETHQHCVLSGSEANRISSTHRVAVTKEDTFEYIRKRAKGALKRFRLQLEMEPSKMDAKVIVFCQRVLAEVEFDWIAQYWLQGAEHDKMHVWWQQPIRTLEALWVSLEELTCKLFHMCIEGTTSVPRLVVKGFLLELESRQSSREQWDKRRADKIYQRRISPEFRPVERPVFDSSTGKQLTKDLTETIAALSIVREQQLRLLKSGEPHQGKTDQCQPPMQVSHGKQNGKRKPRNTGQTGEGIATKRRRH